MNKNTSLIEIKDNIFSKVNIFFKKIFNKFFKKYDIIEQEISKQETPIIYEEKEDDSRSKIAKNSFFTVYNNVVNGYLSVDDVDDEDIYMLNRMLEEECELRKKNQELYS